MRAPLAQSRKTGLLGTCFGMTPANCADGGASGSFERLIWITKGTKIKQTRNAARTLPPPQETARIAVRRPERLRAAKYKG